MARVLVVWVRGDASEGYGGIEHGHGGEDEGKEGTAGTGPFLGAAVGGREALLALGAEGVDDGKDEEEVDDELLEDEEVGVVVPEVVEGEDVATDEEEDVDGGESANGAADYAQEKGRHQKKTQEGSFLWVGSSRYVCGGSRLDEVRMG